MTRLIHGAVTLLLLLCAVTNVLAAPTVSITPQPAWLLPRQPDLKKTIADKEATNGYYLKLYDEQTNAGDHTEYIHVIKQIVNESGVQANSELSFQFSGEYQQLLFHRLSVIRNGQVVNKLSPTAFKVSKVEDALGDHQLSDNYQAVLVLTDLRKGDCIDMAYSLKGANPVFEGKYTGMINFVAGTPVVNHYATVMIPEGRRLIIRNFNNASNPNISRKNGFVVYDWPKTSIQSYEYSSVSTPSWYVSFPYSELSEYDNWVGVGQWGYRLVNHYKYTLSAELKQKVAAWQKQSGGSEAKYYQLATRFVQDDIRYHGVEIGIHTNKPHEPSLTFQNRYGDCKDKSILLVALLRANNIPAYLALVNTNWNERLIEHLPGNFFDHAIVMAEVDGLKQWVDPTMSLQKGAIEDNYMPDYGRALVIDSITHSLTEIAPNGYGNVDVVETYTVPEDEQGTGTLAVKTIYRKGAADGIRQTLSNGVVELEKSYERYYTDLYGKTTLDGNIEVADDTVENNITMLEKYTLHKMWKKQGGKIVVEVSAKPILERLVAPPQDGDYTKPMAISFPCNINYHAEYKMPSDWKVTEENFTIDRPSYFMSFEATYSGDIIYLNYSLRNHKDHVPAAELKQYEEDYNKLVESLGYTFSIDKQLTNNINAVNSGSVAGRINWIMLFLAVMTAAGTIVALIKADKKDSEFTSHNYRPDAISGWLILLAIGVTLRPAIYVYRLFTDGYFATDLWMNLNAIGATGLQLIVMVELVSSVALCLLSGWLVYWFYRKRDVFPRMFIALAFIEYAVCILNLVSGLTIPAFEENTPGYTASAVNDLIKATIWSGIWVMAVMRSPVIQRVFIRPYKYMPVHTEPAPEPAFIQLPSEAPIDNEKPADSGINKNVS